MGGRGKISGGASDARFDLELAELSESTRIRLAFGFGYGSADGTGFKDKAGASLADQKGTNARIGYNSVVADNTAAVMNVECPGKGSVLFDPDLELDGDHVRRHELVEHPRAGVSRILLGPDQLRGPSRLSTRATASAFEQTCSFS